MTPHERRPPGGNRDSLAANIGGDDRQAIRAIACDAFGTLLRITDNRDPWRQIARAGAGFTIDPRCVPGTLPEFAAACGAAWQSRWADDLAAELASIRLHDDARPALTALRMAGLKLAVVSNLALPYVRPVHHVLHDHVDAQIYSYEVGAAKPQPAMFGAVCVALDLPPARILMVGDSLRSDVEGARRFGMPALHLVRDGSEAKDGVISSLAQSLDVIER